MRDFRGLKVWQKAHRLTLAVCRATQGFPAEERYGLKSQLRRGSASIPTNIAEGCGRFTDPDRARFISIAAGSATETEYLLILARDLEYVDATTYADLNAAVNEVKKMLVGFHKTLVH